MSAPATLAQQKASFSFSGRLLAAVSSFVVVAVPVVAVAWFASVRNSQLLLAGALIGAMLAYSGVGFAGSWRRLVVGRNGRGFAATLLLLALATALFVPVLNSWDQVAPSRGPVGASLLVGALIFGIGMQLGSGCGSGTVIGAGSRSTHSIMVLLFFIPGSLLGALHLPWWVDFGPAATVDLAASLSPAGAVAIQLVALALIALLVLWRCGASNFLPSVRMVFGCLAIVGAALIILHISGRMWSVTFAYSLWGAKAAELVGIDMSSYVFWQSPYASKALSQALLADVTTVTTLGLLAGAATVGIWKPVKPRPYRLREFQAAVLGGLLMGYGARLAFGCNIGALFSGIASASLHGWIWFAVAWCGSLIGIALRPRFGMAN
ncbi:MAG: YeeE/YedE family protein [Betaproteobacteria bacterium]|nr:YeeE/YedE family protein [Betaproteobacteria bacterium]